MFKCSSSTVTDKTCWHTFPQSNVIWFCIEPTYCLQGLKLTYISHGVECVVVSLVYQQTSLCTVSCDLTKDAVAVKWMWITTVIIFSHVQVQFSVLFTYKLIAFSRPCSWSRVIILLTFINKNLPPLFISLLFLS